MIAVETAEIRNGGFRLRADLSVAAGGLCAVIGPSGSGKSTLLLGIAGFAPLTAGRIAVAGRDLARLEPAQRPVTMLFQEHNLFPHLSVEANVGLGLRGRLGLAREERAQVARALEEVGLEGLGARLPEALSGGQRQRAALARALLRERPALLLDEPFAALGPALRTEMLALVRNAASRRGMATILVTHDPADARAAAETTAVCADGRIEGARETAALFADPPPGLRAYLG